MIVYIATFKEENFSTAVLAVVINNKFLIFSLFIIF